MDYGSPSQCLDGRQVKAQTAIEAVLSPNASETHRRSHISPDRTNSQVYAWPTTL
jgi:hypothetical protein